MSDWSIQQARDVYHIAQWSDGFFDIGERGTLRAYPNTLREQANIDLYDLAQKIKEDGIPFPVLVRFTDILRKRIQGLNDAFLHAIKDHDYKGSFISAY